MEKQQPSAETAKLLIQFLKKTSFPIIYEIEKQKLQKNEELNQKGA